jgi:hypothetical protein
MFVDRSSDAPRRLFVRLDPGEEVMSTLAEILQAHQQYISAGQIIGIGTVRKAVLGYFDLARRQYLRREVPGDMELASFVGNVTWMDGRPFVHAHVVLSGPDFVPQAGHLFQAEIAATGEFCYVEGGMPLRREEDQATGLKLVVG